MKKCIITVQALKHVNNCVISKYFTSSAQIKVRVRFAPSPTGHLHLGGLRTALYNYLFAKNHGGTFVLRIEDTDQSRVVPDAVEKLERDLKWAGIVPDESPSVGGQFGPYTQSKRLDIYRDQVNHLLETGAAYPCFCSDTRLGLLKREALRNRQVPRYDNKCRHLSCEDRQEKLSRYDSYCIRFKLTPNSEPFTDLVFGPVSYDVAQHEGDPVILKSDKYPTYHLANVVDDHFMEISHVLRGVEWQVSTTKHLLMYKAFGWTPPKYAHLPLLMNPDGTKLSKRQGDIKVESFRDGDIFPLALLNYVTHAGGGFHRDLSDEKLRIFSMEELVRQVSASTLFETKLSYSDCFICLNERFVNPPDGNTVRLPQFSLERINCNSCQLLPEKLPQFNKLELRRQLTVERDAVVLTNQLRQLVASTFPDRLSCLQLDEDHVRSVLNWGQDRVHKLSDLVHGDLAFLWVMPSPDPIQAREAEVLEEIKQHLVGIPVSQFNKEHLIGWLREFAATSYLPFNKQMKLLRQVLSGLKEGPGVAEMMEILGKDITVARLDRSISQKVEAEKFKS
uniref:Nondiscriminating glutamyl-tRNA synthetase EARS2, mitochondrial n=1 Tax=Timema bartmani TaxID=61472 RepID=A0A7R9F1N3_9NEOP|nr:unnamed protein product [Timema bartmani]